MRVGGRNRIVAAGMLVVATDAGLPASSASSTRVSFAMERTGPLGLRETGGETVAAALITTGCRILSADPTK